MDKITIKLIKYFMALIAVIILVCFIASSAFLSRIYISQQYKSMANSAKEIYDSLKLGEANFNTPVNAILIKDNVVYFLSRRNIGIMSFLKSIDLSGLKQKGTFQDPRHQEYLYYRSTTDIGDIVVFESNQYSSEYLRIVYSVLIIIFFTALLLSIPLISYIGRAFTKPILKLQRASSEIAQGNFNADISVETNDEIEDLSNSLKDMSINLEKKYKLQRDFVANVSHDFKTPLSIIRNYSEAIGDGILDENGVKEYSTEIIKEVDRLNYLVIDLLELSKFQGGNLKLEKDYFDLKDFLVGCSEKFAALGKQKNIDFYVNSPEVEILGDSKYLSRVLYNFIDNALKFSSAESKIDISAVTVDNKLKISVKDYGAGIKKEIIGEIWDRYFKHSESGGMGLGLAICSEILKMHDFEYGAESSLESGTEFFFFIPENEFRYYSED